MSWNPATPSPDRGSPRQESYPLQARQRSSSWDADAADAGNRSHTDDGSTGGVGQNREHKGQHGEHEDQHGEHEGQHGEHEDQHGEHEGQHGEHEDQHGEHEGQHGEHEDQHEEHEGQHGEHEDQNGPHESQRREHEGQHSAHEDQHGPHKGQHGPHEGRHGTHEGQHSDHEDGEQDTNMSRTDPHEPSLDKEPSELSYVKNILEASLVRQPSPSSLTKEPTDVSLPAFDDLPPADLPPEYTGSSSNLVVASPGMPFDEKTFHTDLSNIEAEERKREAYMPALPKAEGLEQIMYSSPTASPTPDWEQSTLKASTALGTQYGDLSGKTHSQHNRGIDEQYHPAGSSAFSVPSVRPNQVSPAPQAVVQQSELRHRSAKKEDNQWLSQDNRKKLFIIGADGNTDGAGCCGWVLYLFSILLIIITLPFSLLLCIKVVQEYERAVIFRLGRLPVGGAKGPGIFFIIPCIESYTKIDLRTVSFDVPPQEEVYMRFTDLRKVMFTDVEGGGEHHFSQVLTKDSVTVSVDAVVYYRVSNPTISVANVENAHHSTRLLAQTTLRNNLGTRNMTEILSDRESISHEMQSTLDEATSRWGIKVERVEIKDVRLPVQLQRAMAAEAEATREARAKVIAAEGEQNASQALKNAADIMTQSGAALQLRYLQTLSSISAEKNSTIIFPLPIDMLSAFMNRCKS